MKLEVDNFETLRSYLDGVLRRADHHGRQVRAIALPLAGAIIWSKDPGTKIEVATQLGDMKNVLWVRIGGMRYAFAYRHETKQIEMREGSRAGPVVYSFDDETDLTDLLEFFSALMKQGVGSC